MKIIKLILINILFVTLAHSEEIRYTKSGIPIKFYGLLDIDNVNYDTDGMDTNSVIFKIKNYEKQIIKNNAYIPASR
jgi:hypothetical protein